MSNINSYMKKSDWRLFILFEAASNRQQQQTGANLFFNSILSIYFLLLQTGTCSNIDIVFQNIRSLYSVVIHKLNRSYDYVVWYIYTLPWSESKYITNFSNNKNRLSLFILCIANWLYVIVNSMLTSLTYFSQGTSI